MSSHNAPAVQTTPVPLPARILARPAVRWVKVAWLGSLLSHKAPGIRSAARAGLSAIDNEDAPALVSALRTIETTAATWPLRDLARGAADAVEGAMAEGAR